MPLALGQPQIFLDGGDAWVKHHPSASGGEIVFMPSLHKGGLDKIHSSRHGWLHLLVPSPGIIKILKGRAWEKADAD